jgi:acyl-coenzyme A thioesterase PaaI-like protein
VTGSYYEPLAETAQTGRYRSGSATAGPWADDLQHGGPPNALAVAAAERLARAETGRSDLIAMRIASEFLRPVPVADVETEARVVRAAGAAALVEVVLRAGERDCLHSRVWFVRDSDTTAVATGDTTPAAPAQVPDIPPGFDVEFGYSRSLEWRLTCGGISRPGPGAAWARAATDLTPGVVPDGLCFAALLGDSAGGLSSALDWRTWSFLNVDLDVHLARPVAGEWLFIDAETQLGTAGTGLARATLSDVQGPVGATMQTLVLATRRR